MLTLVLMNRADHMNSIESRIKRMEALLQSSGIVVNSPPAEAETSSAESIEEQTSLTPNDELSHLMISEAGEQKYVGMMDVMRAIGAMNVV